MKLQYKYVLIVAWMTSIFLLSNEVADASSERSSVIVTIFTSSIPMSLPDEILTFFIRKSAHIFMYFVLGVLTYTIAKSHANSTKRSVIFSICFALGYATLDELHQLFVPGRSGELRDILIDTTAAAAGIAAYYTVYKIRFNGLNSKNTI